MLGLVIGILPLYVSPTITIGQENIWRPAPGASIQLQYSGEPIDFGVEADIYDLDLFETQAGLIAALHAKGRRVICYVSVGTLEDWRPDTARFPSAVVGQPYDGWPGESWLDLRALDSLGPVLKARLDLARDKGCDGIDPDNLDGFEADTGFPLDRIDTIRFLRWLSAEARSRGLAIGLKNGADLLPTLQPDIGQVVDWALIEDCHAQNWCDAMQPILSAGMAVFQIEYTDQNLDWNQVCAQARQNSFFAVLKHRNLDAYRKTCW